MRIFITGGTGFLGKPLVKKLSSRGHQILLLKREGEKISEELLSLKIKFLSGDIQSINKLLPKIRDFSPEVGIHLAWEGIPSTDLALNLKNLTGGLNCIETLVKAGCKRVFVAGSCHEYGEPGKKVSEISPLNPFNTLYAAKTALYFLGSKIVELYKVRFVWGRIGFIYGPGQRKASLIPYLLNSIQKNKKPILKNPKGGNDFIYVDDVVRAISMIIKRKNIGMNEVYNIGSGQLTGVKDVVKIIYNSFGMPLPKALKGPKKLQGFYLDISKIKREIGWKPKTSINSGVKKTIDYYKNG